MRTLIVGALAATLVGCSCYVTPQPGLEACTGADGSACLDSYPDARWTVPEPSSDASTTRPKKKVVRRVATAKPLPASDKPPDAGKAATSAPDGAKVEPAAAMQAPAAIDPIVDKAKTAVAGKLEDPKSASFSDMKRSMRKNLRGEYLDTICGHVKSKKASGEDIGDRPFLYLVKSDIAFVADDSPSSPDSTAYNAICN
jgi:hypothetical protein